MVEKVKTFKRERNIIAVNSLITHKGDLFVSVGATGEFWKFNGENWSLEHKLPENQPWIGTTWGSILWEEDLWFGGLEARLEKTGIIVHYDGKTWETVRPKLGPEIWDLADFGEILYAVDSKQILETETGNKWKVLSEIPIGEGRSIERLGDTLYVGTTKGLFAYSPLNDEWERHLEDVPCYDIIKYAPFDTDWLIVGTAGGREVPYYVWDGERWHSVRIGNHMNVERLKMSTFGRGKGTTPLLFMPQTAGRSGAFGGQTGLGRLFVTDWRNLDCLFESACAVTETALYDGEIYFGTAWNQSYESLQGVTASVCKLSSTVETFKRPSFKYKLWNNTEIAEGETTDAVFCPGYNSIWIGFESKKAGELTIEVDPYGDFDWKPYDQVYVEAGFTSLSISGANFTMIRLRFDTATETASAFVNISP